MQITKWRREKSLSPKVQIFFRKPPSFSHSWKTTTSYNFKDILDWFNLEKIKPITIKDLQVEINHLKEEVKILKTEQKQIIAQLKGKEKIEEKNSKEKEKIYPFRVVSSLTIQKWYIPIKLLINGEHSIKTITLFDTGANINYIQERLVPTKFFEKIKEGLKSTNRLTLNRL